MTHLRIRSLPSLHDLNTFEILAMTVSLGAQYERNTPNSYEFNENEILLGNLKPSRSCVLDRMTGSSYCIV